ncbi:MAG: MarR family transcriptional regulator [Lachnospiraceae bacterium]|jgi:DNA-binding MarR family transcriptional regulator|nr:MarR family transcriptional regulator [Lachnospiraceae bacterium]MCI9601845.1 MarR family transcriptional regulator [Lachnospiraceae bacterium]
MQSQFINHQILGNILYEQCIHAACAQHGLIKTEMDILLFLHNNPGFDTATDIVKLRHLSKSHVSKSIQSLKERGWLTAFYQDNNRRTIHLKLCKAADAAIADGLQAQSRFASVLLADFTEEEKKQLQTLLCRIMNNLQTHFQSET